MDHPNAHGVFCIGSRRMALFMSFALILLIIHCLAKDISESPWISPNGVIELYTIQTEPRSVVVGDRGYDTHAALMLRIKGKNEEGVCLAQSKYFEIHWSPDSHYVVVNKVYLTHNSDIDIYEISIDEARNTLTANLIYSRTAMTLPKGKHWTHWEFKHWDLKRNMVHITQEVDDPKFKEDEKPKDIEVDLQQKPKKTITYGVNETGMLR